MPQKRKLWRETHKKENIHSITTKKNMPFILFLLAVFFQKKNQKREKNMRWGRGVGNSFLI